MYETLRIMDVDYLPRREPSGYNAKDLGVRIYGRTASGSRRTIVVTGCRPCCYVPQDEYLRSSVEYETDDWQVLDHEAGYQGIDPVEGGRVSLHRLTLAHPKQVGRIADEFDRTWEADVPFRRRVAWDHGLSGYVRVPEQASRVHISDVETDVDPEEIDPIEPRVVVGDIEVVDESDRSFEAMKRVADAPIVSATWYDSYDDEFYVYLVDPDDRAEPSAVKAEVREHWGDHDLAGTYVEEADITLLQLDSEIELLQSTVAYFQQSDPDVAVGWNFVDFDWYYLLERMQQNDDVVSFHRMSPVHRVEYRKINPDGRGVESAVVGLPAFDQMSGLDQQTYGEWRSKSLEFVASEELGVGKIPGISVAEAYETDRSQMTAYNLLDVQLCVALTEHHGIEEFFLDLADIAGVQIGDTWSEKRVVDSYIGRRCGDDSVLPTHEEREIETPAGGLVLTPGDGVYDLVAVFDLKSLYPSGIVTGNISPETMCPIDDADFVVPGMPESEADVGGSIDPSDINWTDDDPSLPWSQRPKGFRMDVQGVLAEAAEEMFPEREKYKRRRDEHAPGSQGYVVNDNRQGGVKVVHNSLFGVQNSKYYRLARNGIGDAITGLSRYVLWRTAEYVEDLGYDVIYGDTDSVLVSLDYGDDREVEDAILDGKGLVQQINDHMTTVADDLDLPDPHPFVDAAEMPHDLPEDANHLWSFEFEKLYGRFLQVGSKKRYAGTLVWKEGAERDGDLSVTGFESERSDSMEITAEVQRGVLKRVLDGCGFSEVSSYVRDQIDRFDRESDTLHEIGVPWNLSKPLEGEGSYGNLPRARAARFSNEHLGKEYAPGDDFRGYYVRRTPTFVPETDVMALDWTDTIPEGYEVDWTKTISKAFESALTPIVEEVGWTFKEVRTGGQNQPAVDESVFAFHGDPWAEGSAESTEETSTEESDDDVFSGAGAW